MRNIGFIYAVAAAVTWGLVYAIDQKILTKVSPLSLLFVNSLLALIVTLPVLFWDLNSVKTLLASGKQNLILIITSLLLGTAASFFIFSAIKNLDASTASIIEITYPIFVILFSFLLFKQAINIYFALGALLIFAGTVIVIKFG
ncbi:MAG: DMT family transporter [bacterium]|nr:DMT family transporter [bacterium]